MLVFVYGDLEISRTSRLSVSLHIAFMIFMFSVRCTCYSTKATYLLI